MLILSKFKFKSKAKNRLNLIKNNDDYINSDMFIGAHIEIFSNRRIIIEGCKNIMEYDDNCLRLKIDNMFVSFVGSDFVITEYDNKKIMIKGIVSSIGFNNG